MRNNSLSPAPTRGSAPSNLLAHQPPKHQQPASIARPRTKALLGPTLQRKLLERKGDVNHQAHPLETVPNSMQAQVEQFIFRRQPPGRLSAKVCKRRVLPCTAHIEVEGQRVLHIEVQFHNSGPALKRLMVIVRPAKRLELEPAQQQSAGREIRLSYQQIEIARDAQPGATIHPLRQARPFQRQNSYLRLGERTQKLLQF